VYFLSVLPNELFRTPAVLPLCCFVDHPCDGDFNLVLSTRSIESHIPTDLVSKCPSASTKHAADAGCPSPERFCSSQTSRRLCCCSSSRCYQATGARLEAILQNALFPSFLVIR
jgi:hypothetical protein